MSKVGEIEEMIFHYFNDGKKYTVDDFKRKAVALQLIDYDDKYTVKNTLYKIKNYSNVNALGNGCYIIGNDKGQEAEKDITVEKAFSFLSARLDEIKHMNVIKNSSEELQKGKNQIELYNKYVNEFSRILNK